MKKIRAIYEKYGYVPLETPAVEYVDNLGKYIQENDAAEEGIFAWRDSDKSLIALRYDLTAPLSRVVSQYQEMPRPFRRYQLGTVWRDEKPGPGRFREFYQFDIDIVGSPSMMADIEICSIICDVLENLNLKRGEYIVKLNNRKVLNGLLEISGIEPYDDKGELTEIAHNTLRAIDKLERLGRKAVIELLGKGRKDESGDFTKGAELSAEQIATLEKYLEITADTRQEICDALEVLVKGSEIGEEGIAELREIDAGLNQIGLGPDCVTFDPTIVRGLSYYTGPVYETFLTIPCYDDKGRPCEYGSIFSGGRYDGLVKRFLGSEVPAAGASVGLDRLLEALKSAGKVKIRKSPAQVFVATMDKNLLGEYQKIAHELRQGGINTDLFPGKGNLKKQLKYADYWDIPLAIIIGEDEINQNQVSIKNLRQGRELSQDIKDREEWTKGQPAQMTVSREKLLETVRQMLTPDNF